MAVKTIQQMLGYKALTGIIRSPKGGIPEDVLPTGFHRITRGVIGDKLGWKVVKGNRTLARRVNRGDPSIRVKSGVIGERSATINHTREHIFHEAEILEAITQMTDESLQKFGQEEVDRRTADFKKRFTNLRLAMVYSALANGKIWFNADGDLLYSASGAVVTIDFEIPVGGAGVGCTGYIEHNASNRIIDGTANQKWSTAGTDIPGQIQVIIDEKAPQYTGYPIKYAFYGKNILKYILANTACGKLLPVGSPALATLIGGAIPDGFCGIEKWISASRAYFEDSTGVIRKFFGDDAVIFAPEADSSWWDVAEGTYPIPTAIGKIAADGTAAMGQVKHAKGMFSYAHVTDDPTGIKHVAGDTFLCVQKVPKAVFNAVVHW